MIVLVASRLMKLLVKLVNVRLLIASFIFFTSSFKPYLVNDYESELINDRNETCLSANIDGHIITAAHCISSRNIVISRKIKKVYSHSDFKLKPGYSKGNLLAQDIATLNENLNNYEYCNKIAYTNSLPFKSCKLNYKNDIAFSSNCYFPKGYSGKVLYGNNNKACLVYSGYYDIMTGKQKIRIGVFKPLLGKLNERKQFK